MFTNLISLLIFTGSLFFLYRAYRSNKNYNRHAAIINLAVAIILVVFSIIGFLRIRNLIVYGVIIVVYYIVLGFYMANKKKEAALKTKVQSPNKSNYQKNKKIKNKI
jgi:Ca2+/Na+ antiporter